MKYATKVEKLIEYCSKISIDDHVKSRIKFFKVSISPTIEFFDKVARLALGDLKVKMFELEKYLSHLSYKKMEARVLKSYHYSIECRLMPLVSEYFFKQIMLDKN